MMSKNPVWMMAVSVVLMMGALLFGLYPETQAERNAAIAPDRHGVQLAIDDYRGTAWPGVDGGSRVRVGQIVDLGTAAYRRLTGS
ncbi:MAG TPA: hypothetical protein HPQ04_15780 [Rhodospirillaceae bacterium]|nr:hypothetical protein [Rhodospirillaceae bacterium]